MNRRPLGEISLTTKASTFQVKILTNVDPALLETAINDYLATLKEETLHMIGYDTVEEGGTITYSAMLVITR